MILKSDNYETISGLSDLYLGRLVTFMHLNCVAYTYSYSFLCLVGVRGIISNHDSFMLLFTVVAF